MPVSGTLTDEEIIESLKSNTSSSNQSEEESDVDKISTTTKMSSKEALIKINKLRSFFVSQNDCAVYVNFLCSMENFLLNKTNTKKL